MITRERIIDSAKYNTEIDDEVNMKLLDWLMLDSIDDIRKVEDLLNEKTRIAFNESIGFIKNDIENNLSFCFWFVQDGLTFER